MSYLVVLQEPQKAQKCAGGGVGPLATTSHVKGLIGHEQDKCVYGARIGNSANAAICSPVWIFNFGVVDVILRLAEAAWADHRSGSISYFPWPRERWIMIRNTNNTITTENYVFVNIIIWLCLTLKEENQSGERSRKSCFLMEYRFSNHQMWMCA